MEEYEIFQLWLKEEGIEKVDPLEYCELRDSREFAFYLLRFRWEELKKTVMKETGLEKLCVKILNFMKERIRK